ncbi:monoamine oxidase [Sporothrix brasiliensis 5110]|uniref:Amine oxidase n=1 Tax=Sporothrix brasiliensis 5110 TaxID=1398154 RepID=A0A0C2IVU3_9PEZI|nr:monoamine oxidase [Sporothrix brasiliensis 5110]KIH93251.1 monoamine oxidase [Sporothrix brasiliensis 5110]
MKPVVVTSDPHGLFDSRPTFSHVASVLGPSRVIMTAGQVGVDAYGRVPEDLREHMAVAYSSLQRCLEAAGATVQDIIKLVYYIVDYDPNNRVHVEPLVAFLQGHRPATTLVPVPCLARPAFKFEVEAYVAIPQQPTQEVDVVVVGAGLSGLKTAYDLQKSGYSVAVVEARDRVGGKTWSVEQTTGDGKFVDRGAAWINDTNQSEVHALAQALGLKLVVQNTTGNVVQQDRDGSVSQFPYGSVPAGLATAGGVDDMVALRDATEKMCQALDIRDPVRTGGHLDSMTFEQWITSVGGGATALASATVWTRAMLGMEPRDCSALFFLNYCKSGGGLLQMRSDQKNGGQYLRFERGTQSLSIGLAALLKAGTVLLSSPVRSIVQTGSDGGVRVVSARGDFVCKRVVVSVPTPLYKEIRFEPPLPPAKAALASANKLGFINKVIVRYARPWWRESGLCGMLQSFVQAGPASVTRDSSVDSKGQFSLTCFCAGDAGIAYSKMARADRFQAVVDQVKATLGASLPPSSVPDPVGFEEHEWSHDQWAQGCPCPAAPPGAMTLYDHALRTTHGKVHFVGTETAFEWKGYMDGALRSGIRGAEEVSRALSTPKL